MVNTEMAPASDIIKETYFYKGCRISQIFLAKREL